MTSATEKELSVLHKKVATVLLKKLESADQATYLLAKYSDIDDEEPLLPEDVRDYLEKQMDASPALLTVITKFLKDNDITAVVDESKEMSDLDKALEAKRSRRKSVGNVIPLKEEDE